MRRTRHTLALLALLAVAMLAGCTKPAASAQSPQPTSLATVVPAPLTLMTPAEKSRIATSFPIEVPVPAGQLVLGEAQGPSAWDYELVLSGDQNAVMRWYMDAYVRADWNIVSRTSNEIVFVKERAQTRLTFSEASSEPARTRVVAAVGLGTQILSTQ